MGAIPKPPEPDPPVVPSLEQQIKDAHEMIDAEILRVLEEGESRPDGPNTDDVERMDYLRYLDLFIDDILNGIPVPAYTEHDGGGAVVSGGGSGDSGNDDPTGDQPGDQPDGGDAGGGLEAMPGSDVITGRPRPSVPARGARISLAQAVGHRLGGVIDGGDLVRQLLANPGLMSRAGDSDVVRPGEVHLPPPSGPVPTGRIGDPRTGGAVDPAEDDPRHHRPA